MPVTVTAQVPLTEFNCCLATTTQVVELGWLEEIINFLMNLI